jgi:hypothetical protein
MNGYGHRGTGQISVAFGTAIQYLIQPDRGGKTVLTSLSYTDGGTAHTITLMLPIGRTTAVGANAAGQAVLNIAADPGNPLRGLNPNWTGGANDALAANDFIAVREQDGVTRLYKVSSVSTLAITLTTNLSAGTLGGESVWMFGIPTDTNGQTGKAHTALLSGSSSAAVTFPAANAGADSAVEGTINADEPILVNSNNATATGTISEMSWCYSVN